MPLSTETYDLDAERDRLTEEMAEYADQQADAPVGSDAARQAAQHGQRAERLRAGVAWAADTWDADSVTLAALTNGERHRVRDTAEESPYKHGDCYVAAGTYDAPYLEHDPENVNQSDFEDTVKRVVDAHPAFVDWAESRISDLSRVGADTGKSYRDLVLETRARATAETTNG